MKSDREILRDGVKMIYGVDLTECQAFKLEKEYKKQSGHIRDEEARQKAIVMNDDD